MQFGPWGQGGPQYGPLQRLFLVALLLLSMLAVLAAPKAAEARYAAMVIDARTGQVLFARNADELRYPASLTKMMTLYMVFEALENGTLRLDQRLPVSARAAGQPPSNLQLRQGQTITVEQAIKALVTRSANDVATVVGEALGGTEFGFAQNMTRRARQLGMRNTTFRNASGLPDRGQRSTARDMAQLARALMRDYPQYYHYFSVQRFTWGNRTYANHNSLLTNYSGTDGIKTGYIRASGFNLVTSTERGGRRLIGVVFGGRSSQSRDQHMREIMDRAFERINVPAYANMPLPQPKPDLGQLAAATETTHQEQGSRGGEVPAGGPDSWGIQVGAFSYYVAAREAAADAMRRIGEAGRITVVPYTSNNGRQLYRARIMGLDERRARSACTTLNSCLVVSPDDPSTLALSR